MGMISTEIKTLKDRIAQINIELDKHKKLEDEQIKLEEQQECLEEIDSRIESLKSDVKELIADLKQQNMGHIISIFKAEILQLIDNL